jgi:hypothetical protein
MNDILKSLIPTIAGYLGGPGAAIAAKWISDKLGLGNDTVEAVTQSIAGMTGEQLVKVKEIEADLAKHMSDNGIALNLAQIEVNKEEAKVAQNTDKWWVQLWVAGWRPYIGWIGGTGIGYQFILRPLLNGLVSLCSGVDDTFPTLEIQDLIALITMMLGQSWLRSQDKKNGNGNGH